MDRKSRFLERKGLARVFPLAPLPLDAPSSLLSDLQVAVCSPDFLLFLKAPAPALLRPSGWALGRAGSQTQLLFPIRSSPLCQEPFISFAAAPALSPLSDSLPGLQHLCVEI